LEAEMTSENDTTMSAAADTIDEDSLIEAASVPSLASLVKKAKEKGLIEPITGYTAGG
jgi:hypothetical protein